jgi:hypothetical protein
VKQPLELITTPNSQSDTERKYTFVSCSARKVFYNKPEHFNTMQQSSRPVCIGFQQHLAGASETETPQWSLLALEHNRCERNTRSLRFCCQNYEHVSYWFASFYIHLFVKWTNDPASNNSDGVERRNFPVSIQFFNSRAISSPFFRLERLNVFVFTP